MNKIFFDFHASSVLYPVFTDKIKQVVEKFSTLKSQIVDVQNKIAEIPGQMTTTISSYLNFSTQIEAMKGQIDEALNGIMPTLDKYAQEIPNYIDKGRPYMIPTFYAPAGVMVVILLVFLLCLLFFIAEAFYRRLFSPTGNGPSKRKSPIFLVHWDWQLTSYYHLQQNIKEKLSFH